MASLGVYIQVPFCASKCTFCNFSSHVERSTVYDRYARALDLDLASLPAIFAASGISPAIFPAHVDSIYVGGGTPTLLDGESLRRCVSGLAKAWNMAGEVEFTLEATPGSVGPERLAALRAMGVNRLSIGAQTFADDELRAVGRLHSAADISVLVGDARRAGFTNVSLDLIAGLPHQTERTFRHSLEATARLRPEHVSLYLFEVDEKSRLGREVVHGGDRYSASRVPGDDFMAEAYEAGREFLASEGFSQYEISNFALPGFESRHNRKYWQLEPYVGLGAGAHSFDGAHRWSNVVNVQRYMAQLEAGEPPLESVHAVTAAEQVEEFLFLGLRQVQGIDLGDARRRWGAHCLAAWEPRIDALVRDGLLARHADRVRMEPRAFLVSNEIFQEFINVM